MKEARVSDIEEILEYLTKNLADCIYMYIDIKKYGLENPNMKVWIEREQKTNQLLAVVMKYYNNIQLYAHGDTWNQEWLIQLLKQEKASMISGKDDIIQALTIPLGKQYNSTLGMVFQIDAYREFDEVESIEYATVEDMAEISDLIYIDDSFHANYQEKMLEEQLKERFLTGMGRNVIIKQDDKIVAHIATYAEYENIAVTSGLIVHPDYRKSSLGFLMESFLVNELLEEEKLVYTFVVEPKRVALLNAVGAKLVSRYGKMTLKE